MERIGCGEQLLSLTQWRVIEQSQKMLHIQRCNIAGPMNALPSKRHHATSKYAQTPSRGTPNWGRAL
ncbi:hypothetical protein M413DRAFT_444808 [Hebeloma cylindrosporum]|uniref:Uncharacterized protein n=1 Tax=Hebeloma cylindrosporum TaxID=76867 RepID=A0A0C3CDU1_HEBCY|nr:hypothetical protein M413DRAFT_444808 [Hebeloma cylindrosporum h7]